MNAQVIFYNNYNSGIKKKLVVCMDVVSLNRMLEEKKRFMVWEETYMTQYASETKPLKKFHKDDISWLRKRINELGKKWLIHKEDLHDSIPFKDLVPSLPTKNNQNALNV